MSHFIQGGGPSFPIPSWIGVKQTRDILPGECGPVFRGGLERISGFGSSAGNVPVFRFQTQEVTVVSFEKWVGFFLFPPSGKSRFGTALILGGALVLGGSAGAQFGLGAWDGALGRSLQVEVSGGPGTKFLLFFSTRPGPIPLAWVEPSDPRALSLGTELLGLTRFGFLGTSGKMGFQVPVPREPTLAGLGIRTHALSFSGKNRVFGDLSPLRGVHLWPAHTWENLPVSMPLPRIYSRALSFDGRGVLLAGGGTGAMLALVAGKETFWFDPVERTFTKGPGMNTPRGLHTATLLKDGKALLAGGVNRLNDPQDSLEIYDPKQNRFLALSAKMRHKRSIHTASLLADGRVLLAGGLSDMNGQLQALGSVVKSCDLYDPSTGKIQAGPDLSVPRAAHFALPLPGGKWMLGGGVSWKWVFIVKVPYISLTTEVFDPRTGKITPGPAMKVARGFCSTIRLKDGRWLLVGGGTGDVTKLGAPTPTCEIYDPATGKFTLTGSLAQARAMASLFLLPDGRVLAAGGVKGNLLTPLSLTSTEIYDPAKGTWTAGPPLAKGRAGAAECLLPDGTFLLAGGVGTGQSGSAQASGEVFHP